MKKQKIAAAILAGALALAAAPDVFPGSSVIVTAEAASKLAAPSGIKGTATDKTITLKWDAVKGASAYRVYMADRFFGNFEKYKDVTKTECTVDDLDSGKEYKFKIAALVKSGKTYTEQTQTGTVTVKTKVGAPSSISVNTASDSVTLSWYPTTGADAFRVYKYNDKKKKFEKYKDVTDTSCKVAGLKSGTGYKFKIASLVKSGSSYKEQGITPSISAVPAVSEGFKIPEYPKFGSDSASVLKELKMTNYTCMPASDTGTVYMNGSVLSLLSGSADLLMFNEKDKFYGGASISAVSGVDFSEIKTALEKKNGKGTVGALADKKSGLTGTEGELLYWESDTSFKLAQYSTTSGVSSFAYIEISLKYAPDQIKKSLGELKKGIDSVSSLI